MESGQLDHDMKKLKLEQMRNQKPEGLTASERARLDMDQQKLALEREKLNRPKEKDAPKPELMTYVDEATGKTVQEWVIPEPGKRYGPKPVTSTANQGPNGKPLSPSDIEKFGGGRDAFSQLDQLTQTVEKNRDIFGPVAGRISGNNPYDRKAQAVQSEINTARQVIGKFLEGGVLRKEDESKYEKILATLNDTDVSAMDKLTIVRKMIEDRQNANVSALKAQGYDVSGIDIGDIPAPGKTEKVEPGTAFAAPNTKTVGGVTYEKLPDGRWKPIGKQP
jgi:hypothetical protein